MFYTTKGSIKPKMIIFLGRFNLLQFNYYKIEIKA
jgi:hypothetical protein